MKKALFEMNDREREKLFWKAREAELIEQYRQWYPDLTEAKIKTKVRRRLAYEQMGWN